MKVFGAYAKYYNLLYNDKDYAGEAQYVHELIQKHASGARSILDLGCGTGRHDFELAKFGYEITGVDMSEKMLATARSRLSTIDPHFSTDVRFSLNFLPGDIRTVRLNQIFDVVVSLFHVMSYQITNEDLQAAFATARTHLKPGGLFIFDCWYGPAVLTDPPVVRVKRLEDNEISVIRIAEPVMHYNENIVDVNYEVLITDTATGSMEKFQETHRMRYLFMPEITDFSLKNNFHSLKVEGWGTGKEPGADTWSICVSEIA
jgi:SAM-dependent methyltransferase